MSEERTHGVKVRLAGTKRAVWLGSGGSTTTKTIHALCTTPTRAAEIAADLPVANPSQVEWAKAEAIFS